VPLRGTRQWERRTCHFGYGGSSWKYTHNALFLLYPTCWLKKCYM